MKRLLPKGSFSHNVLTLMTGTVIAQAIPVAISPILTRIYSPEEFGLFALYMGLASILSTLATGRYEQAIMLPKDDDDASNLIILSITIAVITSLILGISVFFLNDCISMLLGNSQIAKWLYLLPITVFITGVYQALNSWNNRKRYYKRLAKNRILQGATVSASQTIGGLLSSNGATLIIGDFIGRLIASGQLAYLTYKYDKQLFQKSTKERQILLAKRYQKFPIFDIGASLANISSYQIQNILFPILYGFSAAGSYFLVLRVLQAPLMLVSSSLTDVYKQKIADKNTKREDLPKYYKRMLKILLLTGLPPFTLLMIFGEDLFILVFGDEWKKAGEFIIVLAPMFFIRFIASPLSYFLYLKEKQEINILGNILFLFSALAISYIANSAKEAILYISISFSLIYLLYILYSAKLAHTL